MTIVENSEEKKFKPIDNFLGICPECGGHILINMNGGDCVCRNCGLVIGERRIDPSFIRRAYTERERKKKIHTGAPITPLVAHMSLSTIIRKKGIKNTDLKRAVKWNTRINGEIRSVISAITEIKLLGSHLHIPYYIQSSAVLYFKGLVKANLVHGRRIPNLVVACLLFACRKAIFPRTVDDLMDENGSNDRRRRIMKCYKLIIDQTKETPKSVSPMHFLTRYLSELNLNGNIAVLISQVYRAYIERAKTSGSTPFGIMGGVIYFVCRHKDLNKTQGEIAEVVGVSEVTLRTKYKDIANKIKFK